MSKKVAAPAAAEENIKVVIRCRPLSKTEIQNQNKTYDCKGAYKRRAAAKEPENGGQQQQQEHNTGKGEHHIVTMDRKTKEVRVRNPAASGASEPPRVFTMDGVFDESLPQATVYEETCRPIVSNIIQGYNGTIFAYGQTGTGKTFTMEGVDKPPELKGMVPRAFDQIFDHIAASSSAQFLVRASFLEIYNDAVLDLLADNASGKAEPLDLKEDPDKGVYVKDLKLCVVKTVQEINALAILGQRQSKTGAEGAQLKEAAKINLALSALGNVISALTSQKVGHVPYRDSKLTRLLQDSLGGNTKTVMIANLGPADYNFEETVNTLRFATRAKAIKNKPKINEDPKDAMLREFQDEIAQLKAALAAEDAIAAGLPPPPGYDPSVLQRMGLRAGGSGAGAMRAAGPPKVVKIEKIKTVTVGIAPEEMDKARSEAEAMKQTLAEKQRLKEEELRQVKELLQSKQTNIISEVKETESEIAKKRSDRLAMRQRLADMETAIVHSTRQIDEAKKADLAIKQKQLEIDRQRIATEQAQDQIRAIEDEANFLATKYSDLGQELASKSSKLEKLTAKYQEIKQESEDIQAENQREREQLLETIRELTRHIQLKDFILDNFVPRTEVDKVENRAYWEEQEDAWLLHAPDYSHLNLAIKRPGSAKANLRRPTTDFALAHAMEGAEGGPRFRCENILELALDMPERTTQDYQDANAINAAAQMEQQQHAEMMAMQQQQAQQLQQQQTRNWDPQMMQQGYRR